MTAEGMMREIPQTVREVLLDRKAEAVSRLNSLKRDIASREQEVSKLREHQMLLESQVREVEEFLEPNA